MYQEECSPRNELLWLGFHWSVGWNESLHILAWLLVTNRGRNSLYWLKSLPSSAKRILLLCWSSFFPTFCHEPLFNKMNCFVCSYEGNRDFYNEIMYSFCSASWKGVATSWLTVAGRLFVPHVERQTHLQAVLSLQGTYTKRWDVCWSHFIMPLIITHA